MLPTSIAAWIVIGRPPTVSPASTVRTSPRSNAKSRPGLTPRRWWSASLEPAMYPPASSTASSSSTVTPAPTGPMKPGGPSRSAISVSLAGRHFAPSAFVSLISLRRWSPRRTTTTKPRSSSTTIGSDFSSPPAGTSSSAETAATVFAPGRMDGLRRRGSGSGSGRRPARRRSRPRRWRHTGAPSATPTRRPRTAPCTRARPSRPSSRRRTRRCTTPSPRALEDPLRRPAAYCEVGGLEAVLVAVERVGRPS